MKKLKGKDWGLVILYVFLVLLDLGINIIAVFVPALGSLGETLTETLIEVTSLVILGYFVLR